MKQYSNLWYYVIISLSCILIYFNALHQDFTYLDDYIQVVDNPFIKSFNFNSIAEIFSNTTVGMYQPMTTLIYGLIHSTNGLSSFGFHIASLLLHLFNSLLIFKVLSYFFNSKKLVFILSLLFVTHPMQVESVAWISAFSTLTYSFFMLSAFIYYLRFINSKANSFYWLTLLLFIFACLSKSASVIFPLLLIFYDIYYKKRFKINWLNKIPFFIISLIFGIVTLQTRESAGHLSDLSLSFDWFDRIFLISHSILFYPLKFIAPISLSAFYPYPELTNGSLPLIFYVSPLVLLLIVYLVFHFRKKTKIVLGTLWYLIGIALVLQIIPVGNQITTDRYTYLPMLGLLIILGQLIQAFANKKWFYALLIIPLTFAFLSRQRTSIWENDEKLWMSVLQEYPNVSQAYNNLGSYALKKDNPQEAFQSFNKAIQLQPTYADAYSNRGNLYSQMGNSQKAIEDYNKAIALKEHADAYFNRANEFSKLGDMNSALLDYSSSLNLIKKSDTYTNRAFVYLSIGDINSAQKDLNSAISLDPNYPEAYYLLASIEQNKGNKVKACQYLKKSADLGYENAQRLINTYCSN